MIRRLEKIQGCGIFRDFRWDSDTPEFERINLVYGSNGSGKTSFARALDALSSGEAVEVKVSAILSDQSRVSSTRTGDRQSDQEFDRLFVFSDAYVAENHDFSAEAEVEAVLTLGKRTLDDERRLTELRELQDTLTERLRDALRDESDADKVLDDAYMSFARSVVVTLSRAGGRYQSNSNYNTAVAKRRFNGSHDGWIGLTEADMKADLATINSDERQEVDLTSHSFKVREGLRRDVLVALEAAPVAVVLDTLGSHPEATLWVEQGRYLHVNSTQCLYCGGALSAERRREVEQHFSNEVERVQSSVDHLVQEVAQAESDLQRLLGDGAIAGSLYGDLRSEFTAEHEAASKQKVDMAAWLEGVRAALEKKRVNVVKRVSVVIEEPPSVDGLQLDRLLVKHNDRVAKHGEIVEQAAFRVERHLLKEAESRISTLKEAAEKARAARKTSEARLNACQEQVAALENTQRDALPSAETMSRELSRILGRSELEFKLLPNGRRYSVTRHGSPARGLSTGERTAITLIHFLEHVRQAAANLGSAIVAIDDPISSLDSGVAMGISTYIWSETVLSGHVDQVFLLTHNFELFRQWDVQIEDLPGRAGPMNTRGFTSNCYELVARHEELDGTHQRTPSFIAWPPSADTRKKVRSAYHHGFFRIVHAYRELLENDSMERRLDAMLLYPNVLRRVLETFLAFKDPSSLGNFTGAMRAMGDRLEELRYQGDAGALRLQLTRFTHTNSHAASPETDAAVAPDEIGSIFAAAFAFMHAIDSEHFLGLCHVIAVDPGQLLDWQHPDP